MTIFFPTCLYNLTIPLPNSVLPWKWRHILLKQYCPPTNTTCYHKHKDHNMNRAQTCVNKISYSLLANNKFFSAEGNTQQSTHWSNWCWKFIVLIPWRGYPSLRNSTWRLCRRMLVIIPHVGHQGIILRQNKKYTTMNLQHNLVTSTANTSINFRHWTHINITCPMPAANCNLINCSWTQFPSWPKEAKRWGTFHLLWHPTEPTVTSKIRTDIWQQQ